MIRRLRHGLASLQAAEPPLKQGEFTRRLLDNISFEVKGGEVLAIMVTDGEFIELSYFNNNS